MNTKHTPGPWRHDATWSLIKHGKAEAVKLGDAAALRRALIENF